MKIRHFVPVVLMALFALAPLAAQDQPEEPDPAFDEEETALDVLAEHERTSVAYDLFGEEFARALDAGMHLAFFVPADDVLVDLDPAELSPQELQEIAERHTASGIVATQSLEFIESFVTTDGRLILVSMDVDGNPLLNGEITVIETIEVANGFVYIIDGWLDGPDL